MSPRVRVYIYRRERVEHPEETILSLGRRFAGEYGLRVPREILRPTGAKPRFSDSEICFSLSHSGEYWVCALGNTELGVDIQRYQRCKAPQIARRFFHPNEALWLKDRDEAAFFAVWTAKESYVKFTGEGITDDFSSFSVVDGKGGFGVGGTVLRHLPFLENYALCLCTAEEAETEIVYPE